MPDYLLQQATPTYWPHLDLTAPVHRAYCERHGLQYVVERNAPPVSSWVGFQKLPLLKALVEQPDTGFVLWLDADALAVGNTDPRTALGDGLVGMTRHPGRTTPTCVNAGVIFLAGSQRVADWLQMVIDNGPGVWPWYEQDIMNASLDLPEWEGQYVNLPHIWNSTECLGHPPDCEIRAWHGGGSPSDRLAKMRSEMARRGLR